jgi:hypothetical protein
MGDDVIVGADGVRVGGLVGPGVGPGARVSILSVCPAKIALGLTLLSSIIVCTETP